MEHLLNLPLAGDIQHLAFISLTFLLAGAVKGVIGLGLPTVAIGLLGLTMTPMEAAALLIVPSLVTNVWQLIAGPNLKTLMRRVWPMLIGISAGTTVGAATLGGSMATGATLALGVALMLYAGVGLLSLRFSVPPRAERWLAPVVGAVTGVVTAVTGVFVIPAVPYLQAIKLEKDDLVQAMGLTFTVSTLALAVSLTLSGAFRVQVAGASLLALLPALAGMFAGQWIRTRVPPALFRTCLFAGLLALGMHLVLRTLM
jgi:uncharacterized membrane protein YfcA